MPKTNNNDDVSALLEQLKKGFIADIPDKLDNMESIILLMDKGENFSDNYESLYRIVHSLKGTAGTHGLHFITSVCHTMEDILNEVGKSYEKFSQYGGDYWLKYVDLIRSVLNSLEHGEKTLSQFEDILTELQSTNPVGSTYEYNCMIITTSSLYESLIPSNFKNQNIRFSFCSDGYEALGRLLSEKYDIVISDYEMPLMNGLSIFGAIRLSDGKNKYIKTVLLTSKHYPTLSRQTDPDYVVYKDQNFTDNIVKTIKNIMN